MQIRHIQTFLSIYYVRLLEIHFFLFILAFIFNFKYIKEVFAEIGGKNLLLLLLIAIIGATSISLINPRNHRIYYDEDIYNSIGQCIAYHKRAVMCNEGYYESGELKVVAEEYNKQPAGYPYLISVIFRIFGTNKLYVFIYNNIIFGLAAIVVFLITFLLFNNIFASFAASLSYILIPVNMQWFNTCAIEPSAAFFASVAVLTSLIYLKNKKPVNLFFFITALTFAFNFRPESFLIIVVVGFLFILKDIKIFTRKELYFFLPLFFILSTGIVIHLYAVRGQSWGASGSKFSLEYFSDNFRTNSMFYLRNNAFPLLLFVFGIIGLFFYKNRVYIREKLVVLSWFWVFWGVFLFFYAGTYEHDVGLSYRFSLLSYAPISIFVGLGVCFVRELLEKKVQSIRFILIILLIYNTSFFLPFVRTQSRGESAACRIDHKYAMRFRKLLPENSIIFTHNPNMFLIQGQSAIQTSSEFYNPGTIERCLGMFKGGVYVHFNYWSGVSYDRLQREFTQNILDKYNCELMEEHYYKSYRYALYRVVGLKYRDDG